MLDRLHRMLSALFALGAGASMAGLFLIILLNALRRYFLGRSWSWGEQLPVFIAIYGVMFGVALACLQDRHISFAVLRDLLGERLRRALAIVSELVIALCGAMLVRSALLLIDSRGAREASGIVGAAKSLARQTGQDWIAALGTQAPWQFALVIGGVAIALAGALQAARRIRDFGAEV
ncbi:tripartite ATP-independent transporter DctQ subunit [Albidovulum inexpectatum]|uniref:TRAP transporter small permease protein n=1 Tax=Albidovulum inexpectatum TaxID=196587 RepID=A0A2S5JHQ2_9RHOB|nr:TRAP transporter small permease [Albidovulum inexpectatum]PPB80901.1 tripartite ATP-independent transporter DctQ subunit [Albidovulum inexpectatum]